MTLIYFEKYFKSFFTLEQYKHIYNYYDVLKERLRIKIQAFIKLQ